MPQPISPDEITQLITQGIPDAEVKIQDLTGGGDHYEALVISASFDGKMKVARHRMVYGSLQDAMVERIHALKLSTLTPQEFEAQASELMSIQPGKTT
jgi:stress-induced morphogen